MSSLIKPEVRAVFPEFTVTYEGRVPTMYADVLGLITIGLGCLIDPVSLAVTLPFRFANGTPATRADIAAEWNRLKRMDLGKYHWRLQARYASLSLHLEDDAIDELARVRLDQNAAVLAKRFPAFPDWPCDAQLATLSMAWAAGAAFYQKFPAWSACADRQDWAAAALECKLRETGPNGTPNPGVIPRNRANMALFNAAAAPPVLPLAPGFTDTDRGRLEFMLRVWLDDQVHGAR